MAADCVDFIDKDDGRRGFFGRVEKVTYTRRTHTDIHFHEIRTGNREERHIRFSGDCLGKQRFTRAGRADKQHAARNFCTKLGKLFRILQEVHDFFQFFFFLIRTGHIGKHHFVFAAEVDACAGFSEGIDFAALAAHSRIHGEKPQNDKEHDHKDIR